MKRKKVLIVDDDTDLLEAVSHRVAVMGYFVVKAKGGAEAIRMVLEENPDLIVLDLVMPDMTGHEVLTCLGYPDERKTPVVILTSQTRAEEMAQGYREGVQYFLTKPFRMVRLENAIRYFIDDLDDDERRDIEMTL